MKFKVQMKDPDTLNDAIDEALEAETAGIADEDERDVVKDVRGKKVRTMCSKWFEYSEYLTVEIDTDAGTCTVMPVHS